MADEKKQDEPTGDVPKLEPAVSPTGRPRVPAKLALPLFAGSALCAAVAAASQIPGVSLPGWAFSWAVVGSIFFASVLGLSPGWRK